MAAEAAHEADARSGGCAPPAERFGRCALGAARAGDHAASLDVKLVSIFVNVTDRDGAIVGGLTRDDFALFEDGRPQQIAVFERQSALPLNLTLAIDTSGSVRKDMSEEAARRGSSRRPSCARRTR